MSGTPQGYPPQQGGYPQQPQGNYPPQQGGYPQQPYQQQGGYPQQGAYPQQPYGQQQPYYGDPNAGKIPGLVIAGFILSFLCPLIGLILCAVGMGEAKRRNAGGGLAIAGICIAIFMMIIGGMLQVAANA